MLLYDPYIRGDESVSHYTRLAIANYITDDIMLLQVNMHVAITKMTAVLQSLLM